MPKIEAKALQKELESGKVRPVYFLHGPERMKSRELVRRILRAALAGTEPNAFNFEKLDAGEVGVERVLDATQGFSLGGGVRVILVRNVEDWKNLDPLGDYLKPLPDSEAVDPAELQSVLILVSKSFDGRKKASKTILDSAAVTECEEVLEQDREPWVDYLAKRRGIRLEGNERLTLRGLEPWSLDIVDQELAKLELVGEDTALRAQALLSGVSAYARDDFIDSIFCRDLPRALGLHHLFCADMEVQLPFLGLLSWNLRHLKLYVLEQETRSRSLEKRNPYLLKNLERWRRHWNSSSLRRLEQGLFGIDFSLKNTRLLSAGLWTDLLVSTGRKGNP
jgi:DNA polymerase III delta subunit